VSRSDQGKKVHAMGRTTQALTDTQRDGSPTFSPDGPLLLYAANAGGRSIPGALSAH
jgi:Tol biopolymer transport system component